MRSNMRQKGRPRRTLARRVLVMTEGKLTEPSYIEGFCAHFRLQRAHVSVKAVGVGADPLKVVRACVDRRDGAANRGNAFDDCFCLIDVDEHTTIDEALALAKRQRIRVIVSNPKFEVWLRWHVDSRRGAMMSKDLDDFLASKHLLKGKQIPPDFPYEQTERASTTARQADPDLAAGRVGDNPSTAMPVLIDVITAGNS